MKENILEISKRIDRLDFKDRFDFFEISNFLDKEYFNNLRSTYPDKSFFSSHTKFSRSFTNESDNYLEFIEKNEIWKNFIEKLNTKAFVEDLISLFNFKNVYFSDKIWKKNIPIFKKVKLNFCFNISEDGAYSMPHTDGSRKLVSIVLFFVDNSWGNENGGQVNLYKPKYLEYENNWRNELTNKENLEVIKTIIPTANSIYGFKKTKNSYHSVEPVKVINNLYRKTFMINLIYEKKSDSPYHQKNSIYKKIKEMINPS